MNDLVRGVVHDRSFPLLPPLLARKWSSWQVAKESTVLGEFLGWENSAPLSGQPWCLFARRGLGPEHLTGLLPVPTSVPGIGLGGRISDNVSWEDGNRGGWSSLSQSQPGCAAPTQIRADFAAGVGRFVCEGRPRTRKVLFLHFAGYRTTRRVRVHPANPAC